jgi:intein-encoded DNA endonuclease-like protein
MEPALQNNIVKAYLNGVSIQNLSKQFNLHEATICRYLHKNNVIVKKHTLYKIQNNFENISSEFEAYFLGLMITDGTVHSKRNAAAISLLEADKNVLEIFSNFVYGQNACKIYNVKNSNNKCCKLSFYNKELKDNLIKHGCCPRKTFVTTYPEVNGLHDHFIRGLFDGDGCIYISKNERAKVIFVGTKALEDGIINMTNNIYNLNINYSFYQGKKYKKNICEMTINRKEDVRTFLNFIYKDATVYINRKYEKYKTICL